MAARELREGLKAPGFRLAATGGREIGLADFAGKNVALFFYPKDSTSG